MSWRFARRFAITRLVRLNVSKRGASVSVGPRGATVTVNPHGVRGTVGLPGTGLSVSKYIALDRGDADTRRLHFFARVEALFTDGHELTVDDLARVLLWQEQAGLTDADLSPEMRALHQGWRDRPEVQQALAALRFVAGAEVDARTTPAAPHAPSDVRWLWLVLGLLAALSLILAWAQSGIR